MRQKNRTAPGASGLDGGYLAKVRRGGEDTPETVHPTKAVQQFEVEASASTSASSG